MRVTKTVAKYRTAGERRRTRAAMREAINRQTRKPGPGARAPPKVRKSAPRKSRRRCPSGAGALSGMMGAMGKMAALGAEPGEDAFRKLFRFYRQSRPGTADLGEVIDFTRASPARDSGHKVFRSPLSVSSVSEQDAYRAGLQPINKWKAYGLEGYPGFIFIPNPFLPGCQRHWVRQCLKLYSRKPSVCNLDKHMVAEETRDLWGQSQELLRNKDVNKKRPRSLLEKLRWVTLGYHYNWDNKTYSADHYTPFPPDLAYLSKQVAAACGFQDFQAEAGILNYYRLDSTLGIHVDRSELDHTKPLLSFSFGQSAIFLLGGLKRDEVPTAMFMHSGDIMVMSGFSRLLNHAVPRVLPNFDGTSLPRCLEVPLTDSFPTGSVVEPCSVEDWQVCANYLQTARVNVTVRQVLAIGQDWEDKETKTTSESSCRLDDKNNEAKRPRMSPNS